MIIKPPQRFNCYPNNNLPWIFLAGSIEQDTAERWQDTAEDKLKHSYNILNPRRDNWDSTVENTFTNPSFYQQVDWELDALEKADKILMYFSPNTKSPISLLELGLYAKSGKILVCCPKEFWRRGNVEIICNKYNILFFETLEGILEHLYLNKHARNKQILQSI